MPDQRFDQPRLIADVGGTYARFALEVAPYVFEQAQSLRCADLPIFMPPSPRTWVGCVTWMRRLCAMLPLPFANPVAGDDVRMTNPPLALLH